MIEDHYRRSPFFFMPTSPTHTVRLATDAMATRFELVLVGDDPSHLRAAGEEAIREIERIATRFSFYDKSSELSSLNRQASVAPQRVTGDLFELLQMCSRVHDQTAGAFDPTIGPLMRTWSFAAESTLPSKEDIQKAVSSVGWKHVRINPSDYTVFFDRPEIAIDLGGIAKGWALDEAASLLQENGVHRGLLHGGTSSVIALGKPSDGTLWKVGIDDPYEEGWFTQAHLDNESLSVSAIHGKSHEVRGIEYGHVIDPTTGEARTGPIVASVQGSTAAYTDAWSTALIAMDPSTPFQLFPGISQAASFIKSGKNWIIRSGNWPE